jgi:hypothetical protein
MKQIKFRVWQKRIKQYETENRFFLCQFDGLYEWDGRKLTAISLSREDYVVEMFTGFLDSEGKEIYEGDIVQYELVEHRCEESVSKQKKEVQFINRAFYPCPHKEDCEDEFYSYELRNFKITDNIHEVSNEKS